MKHILTQSELDTLKKGVSQANEARDLAIKELDEWKDENVFKGTITEIVNSPGFYSAFGMWCSPTSRAMSVAHYEHLKSFETAISGITEASDEETIKLLNEGTTYKTRLRSAEADLVRSEADVRIWKGRARWLAVSTLAWMALGSLYITEVF